MVTKNRIDYYQFIRGLLIVLVVLIHSKTGISYESSELSWNFDYWLLLRSSINFPVAIFIYLSGYFTKVENVTSDNSYVKIRVRRLLIPFLTWSAVYSFIKILFVTKDINIFKDFIKLLLGMQAPQLYFIVVLIQLTILSPYLINTIKTKKSIILMLCTTPIYLISVYWYTARFGTQFLFYQMLFPAWLIFYYTGLLVKIKGYPQKISNNRMHSLIFFVIALGFSILESYTIKNKGFSIGFAASQIKVSSFIYTFAVINLLVTYKKFYIKKSFSLMRYLGDNSFGIYFVHMVYIPVADHILSGFTILNNVLPLFQLFQVIITVTLSILTIILTRKILGRELANRIFGF